MRKPLYILLFSLLLLGEGLGMRAYGQNLDSLTKVYNNPAQPDTNRLKAINVIAWSYKSNNPDTAIVLAKQELALAVTLSEVEGQAKKGKKYQAKALNTIGVAFNNKGNYPEALKNYFAALKACEEIKNKQGIASSYNNIGNIYANQGNYPEALKNHFAALKIFEEIKDKQEIAYSYINIGIIYWKQVNYPEALKNYFTALKICEEIKDKQGISISLSNMGGIYYKQSKYSEALKNYFASLKIFEEIGDKYSITATFISFGQLFTTLKKTKEAQGYLDSALQLSKEIGINERIKETYAGLTVLDSLTGNYKAAFEHHKLFIIYRDSLNNEETKKKSLQASMQYEFDKKEIAAKAEQDKLDAINTEEKKKQQLLLALVSCILILVGVFAVFMFNRFRITSRQKHIIELQKQKVDEAYEQLNEKNKEVMDSIHYAKRIQTALITSEKYIANSLNRLMKSN